MFYKWYIASNEYILNFVWDDVLGNCDKYIRANYFNTDLLIRVNQNTKIKYLTEY